VGISAISMSLLALSWEGVGIFTSIIALVEMIRLILEGYSKRDVFTWTLRESYLNTTTTLRTEKDLPECDAVMIRKYLPL